MKLADARILEELKMLIKIFLFFSFVAIAHGVFAQQSGDITPPNFGRFEKLRTDQNGNIYVYQDNYPSEVNFLLKHNGMKWEKIGMDTLGWYAIYNYEIDKDGNLYLYGAKSKEEKPAIYSSFNGTWKKLPDIFSNPKMQGIFMNGNSELMAYGQFYEDKKQYYMVVWRNEMWVPFHDKIKNKFIVKEFEHRNTSRVRADRNGNIYIYFYNYDFKSEQITNYFVVSNGKDWKLLDTLSHNFPESIRDFEVDSKGNLYVAGGAEPRIYCLASYSDNKWNILDKKKNRIECLEISANDEILIAGELEGNSINKWVQNGETNFAFADDHVNEMALSGKELAAIVGIGNKFVYRMKQGDTVIHRKVKSQSEWQNDFFKAVEKWDEAAIKAALNYGAVINAYNENGKTALGMVITGKPEELNKVKFLVENKADVNIRHEKSWTSILDWAIYEGNIETIKYLISKGANVNKLNGFDQTPALHAAIRSKQLEIVKLVVDAGADINAVSYWSREKRSPLKIAEEMGLTQIITYLKSKGAK